MGVGWLGFAAGASATALDSITAREEEDSKKKLFELQERLRRETAEIERGANEVYTIRAENRALGRPKTEAFEGTDRFMRDSFGKEITGTRTKMNADEIAARENEKLMDTYKLEGERLGLDVKRSSIRENDASAAYSRRAGSAVGKGGALDGASKDLTIQERVQEAIYRNKDLITSVTGETGTLGRGTVEVGIENLIKQMIARKEDPTHIDSKIRQHLIPMLKKMAVKDGNLKAY